MNTKIAMDIFLSAWVIFLLLILFGLDFSLLLICLQVYMVITCSVIFSHTECLQKLHGKTPGL